MSDLKIQFGKPSLTSRKKPRCDLCEKKLLRRLKKKLCFLKPQNAKIKGKTMACIQAEYQENEKGAKSGLKIHHQAHHYIIIND